MRFLADVQPARVTVGNGLQVRAMLAESLSQSNMFATANAPTATQDDGSDDASAAAHQPRAGAPTPANSTAIASPKCSQDNANPLAATQVTTQVLCSVQQTIN